MLNFRPDHDMVTFLKNSAKFISMAAKQGSESVATKKEEKGRVGKGIK